MYENVAMEKVRVHEGAGRGGCRASSPGFWGGSWSDSSFQVAVFRWQARQQIKFQSPQAGVMCSSMANGRGAGNGCGHLGPGVRMHG